jgi:hypothetical protein
MAPLMPRTVSVVPLAFPKQVAESTARVCVVCRVCVCVRVVSHSRLLASELNVHAAQPARHWFAQAITAPRILAPLVMLQGFLRDPLAVPVPQASYNAMWKAFCRMKTDFSKPSPLCMLQYGMVAGRRQDETEGGVGGRGRHSGHVYVCPLGGMRRVCRLRRPSSRERFRSPC